MQVIYFGCKVCNKVSNCWAGLERLRCLWLTQPRCRTMVGILLAIAVMSLFNRVCGNRLQPMPVLASILKVSKLFVDVATGRSTLA